MNSERISCKRVMFYFLQKKKIANEPVAFVNASVLYMESAVSTLIISDTSKASYKPTLTFNPKGYRESFVCTINVQ